MAGIAAVGGEAIGVEIGGKMNNWQIIAKRWRENLFQLDTIDNPLFGFAKNDVLDLLDEIERLQAKNEQLRAELDESKGWTEFYQKRRKDNKNE